MKKVTLIVLALLLSLSLFACGKAPEKEAAPSPSSDSEASQPSNADPAPAENNAAEEKSAPVKSRLAAFIDKYISGGDYFMRFDSDGDEMDIAVKGEKKYCRASAEAQTLITIETPDAVYLLSPDSLSGMKLKNTPDVEVEETFEDVDTSEFVSGEDTVKGVSLYYEEIDEGDEKTRYYFDGEELKYILTVGKLF